MNRPCNAKIVATLGPASADRATIEALVKAGADVLRLNFSHGTQADHQQRLDLIRRIESDLGRPIGVLLDLQGPKLRVGTFANGPVRLVESTGSRCPSCRAPPTSSRRKPSSGAAPASWPRWRNRRPSNAWTRSAPSPAR